jgi:membrane protease YdiL (CAAX protease family)
VRPNTYLSAFIIWLILLSLAILNGAFRIFVLEIFLSSYDARIVSGMLLMAVIVGIAFIFVRLMRIQRREPLLWRIGAMWLALTVAFEFLFGRYAMRQSWAEILEQYNLLEGQIWPLVLIVILISPALAARMLRRAVFRKAEAE